MKLLFKILILFLIVFNFKIPYFYNTVFLSILLSGLYYIFDRKTVPFTYFTYKYNIVIIVGTLAVAFIIFTITTLHEQYSFTMIRRLLVQLSMLFAVIFAFPIFVEGDKSNAYEKVLTIICYTFALQGLIHLSGYLFPAWGDYLISIKPQDLQDLIYDPERNVDLFRGYALSGSIFFELPSAYGVAVIMFIRLQLIEGQEYITGYKSFIVFLLLISGIMLSGRIGFVGVGIGVVLYFFFIKDPVIALKRVIKSSLVFIPVILIIYFLILTPAQRWSFQEELFPFAFEFFYNYEETGELRTHSSDATLYSFYYPLMDETLIKGHGIDNIYQLLRMYPFTDAGYMKSLLFGGIPYLICLLIYQFLYFYQPISIASKINTKESKIDLIFFISLYVYILLLHYKDVALGMQHLTEVLFLSIGLSYLIKYYSKPEES